jgi:hypothetical protein
VPTNVGPERDMIIIYNTIINNDDESRPTSARLHDKIYQKAAIFIFAAVRTLRSHRQNV